MSHLKFDIAKLEKLNDPDRFRTLIPEAMWAALGEPHPATIVDIGAGTGLFASKFSELAPGAVVMAADIEPVMVEWMTENRPEVADGRLVPVLATETGVPLDDGIADLVTMVNLHHELADKDASYAEAHRLLVPGGQLLVVDWAPVDSPKGPPISVRWSGDDASQLLRRTGFGDVRIHDVLPWHWMLTAVRLG